MRSAFYVFIRVTTGVNPYIIMYKTISRKMQLNRPEANFGIRPCGGGFAIIVHSTITHVVMYSQDVCGEIYAEAMR